MLNRVKFDLMAFDIEYLTLENFRYEILFLFEDYAFYDFKLGVTYYIHLIDTKNKVFSTTPFLLLNLEDEEEFIAYCYNNIINDLEEYLDKRNYEKYILMYISMNSVEEVEYKYIYGYLTKRLIDLDKMCNDLMIK
jgi:hypothetical protein